MGTLRIRNFELTVAFVLAGCVADPPPVMGLLECDDSAQEEVQRCDATVGHYVDCFTAVLEQSAASFTGFDCDAFADFDPTPRMPQGASPFNVPACEPLMGVCPQAFIGSDSGGPRQ